MMKHSIMTILLAALLLTAGTMPVYAEETQPATMPVPADYELPQEAVDTASCGKPFLLYPAFGTGDGLPSAPCPGDLCRRKETFFPGGCVQDTAKGSIP